MAFTQKIVYSVQLRDHSGTVTSFNWTETNTQSGVINVSQSVADAETDTQVTFALVEAEMQSFVVWSTVAMTLETNNGTTPDDDFTLAANKPVVWTNNGYLSNPITADITTDVFVTNASGSAGDLNIRAIIDATP
jgi:hypothetical protein